MTSPLLIKLFGNLESNPEAGLISIKTPIAKGLMGKNVGDEVSISTPSGTIELRLEKSAAFIKFMHADSWALKAKKLGLGLVQYLN